MKKTAYYSDLLFFFLIGFAPALFYFRFFNIPLSLSLILSGVFGGLSAFLFVFLSKKKRKKYFLKHAEEEEQNAFLDYLRLLPKEKTEEFFKARANCFPNGKTPCPLFKFQPLNADDIAEWYKGNEEETPLFLYSQADDGAKGLLYRLGIPALDGRELYLAVKEKNALPKEITVNTPTAKRRWKLPRFQRRESRRFLGCAVLLLFSALLVPYPLYYIIAGVILLILAVLIRIFGIK